MLKRLKRRADFLAVAAARRKWVTPGLILQVRCQKREARAIRVGFTASRKVGSAVARNRAKRRLRALAEQILPRHAVPCCDYVLIARQDTVNRPFQALSADLTKALQRLHRRKNTNLA